MSRTQENEKVRDYVDELANNSDILKIISDDPTLADSYILASIGTYLMDISKSLAVIADTMTGGVEKDARDN